MGKISIGQEIRVAVSNLILFEVLCSTQLAHTPILK